jgi:antitoxin component YwqK of YwqJK toxin-antitoxin module
MKYIIFIFSCCLFSCENRQQTYLSAEKNEVEKSLNTYHRSDSLKKFYYPNGKLKSEIPVSGGKKNGIAKKYYQNGTLKCEMTYKDDIPNGVSIFYREDGTKDVIQNYKDNLPDGTWIYFKSNGIDTFRRLIHINGVEVSSDTFP